jgi:hypothetical protein
MSAARLTLRRPRKLHVAGGIAVLALALAGTGAPAAATAAAGAITVVATPADSGDLGPGDSLRIVVSLDNPTADPTTDTTASVSVDPSPAVTRSSLAGWFAGTGSNTLAPTQVGAAAFPAVGGGLDAQVVVSIPASALPWTASGVYPIAVTVGTGTKVLGTAHTAAALNVSSDAAVPVAVAVPLTVPPSGTEFLTAAQLTQYTAPGGVLTRELDDVQNTQIAVGIDPRILASIRILGKNTPQSATDWLTELTALPNDTFPLAWADADVTAPLHAGAASVLETKPLDYAIDPNLFPPTTNPTTPTPTPTAGTLPPTAPTSASLVQFNYTMPSLSWPAENSVVNSDLGKLSQAGLTAAILSSTNVAGVDDGRGMSGAAATSAGTGIAVSDAVLSGYLRTAIQSTTHASSSEALTELTTTLALVSLTSGASSHAVLLTLGRNWASNDTNFDRSISEIYARPWTSPEVLSSLFNSAATTVKIVPKSDSSARLALVKSMLSAEQGIVDFSAIATSPDALTSSARLRLLGALSNEWTTSAWAVAAQAFVTQSNKIVDSVQVDPSSEIVVISNQTALPITVSNNLDQDVTVTLTVRSGATLLTVDKKSRAQSVTVDEGSQRRIQIPVDALSNGNAEIVATLFSSTGAQVGRSVTIQVKVNAGWETTGTLIFAALIAGLFAFGIIRNIRKRRKAAPGE